MTQPQSPSPSSDLTSSLASDLAAATMPTAAQQRRRNLPPAAAFTVLRSGWRDLVRQPGPSLAYGLVVFAASLAVTWTLVTVGLDYILFPALAGFMVLGPLVAIGLYEKSRALEAGERVSLRNMLLVRARSGAQVLYTGAILMLLMLLWMRAAVIIYALFFGYGVFPGLDRIAETLFTTPTGWAMLATGTLVGALFAAFGFAISAFSIPMLLDRQVDAFTAMGTSISVIFRNLPFALAWGALCLVLFLVCVATGLLGLIVIFPLLGHATWHAYRALE